MGLAQVHVDAVAGTASLTDQGRQATSDHGDSDTGGVGHTPAGLLLPADLTFGLGDASHGDGLPLPAVKTKDAVGFRHRKPPLDIRDLPAALLPLTDVGPIERGSESSELLGGEAGRRSLRGFRH